MSTMPTPPPPGEPPMQPSAPAGKTILTETELRPLLAEHPDWSLREGRLIRQSVFPDFAAAMAFVHRVAELAEASNHHPDILIRYNRVELALISHDAGGITTRDVRMAKRLSSELPSAAH